MKVPKQEDKPDTFEGPLPPGVFPDKMTAGIQQAFHEYTENRIPDCPEPTIRYAQNFVLFIIQKSIVRVSRAIRALKDLAFQPLPVVMQVSAY